MLQVERKDALKAFQKTKYFTLCECTVIFNRKKGPPKLNGNLRNNMQSGSNSSRKQEFRHERDREFGTEKRPRRSRDPTRSKSSSKPASRNQQKKNSWWKIWQNPNGEIQELPITFISDGIFGLVFFARRPRIVITHWLFLWPNGCGGSPPKLPRFSMLETF